MNQPIFRTNLLLMASLMVSACSTTLPKNSISSVQQALTKTHPAYSLNTDTFSNTQVPAITSQPLSLHDAVQILLSHSPQVRAQIAALGIADAQRLQAELMSNPHLSIGALKPEDGGRWQLDVGLSQPLLELFTRPLRKQLAEEALLTAQVDLQKTLQELIAEASDKYIDAVAAQQHLHIQQQILEATKARQALAAALYKAGNMSESNFLYYDNELRNLQRQINKRTLAANQKQLALKTFIGLESTHPVSLPQQLPHIPEETFSRDLLLTHAKQERLDIKIAQQKLNLLQQRRALIQKEYGWRDINLGINAEREFDGATHIGPEIEFALPLFHRGQAKIAALNAKITEAQAEIDILALTADKEIAMSIDEANSSRQQITLLQQALVVAKKRVELSGREVNFMLTSPFDLLNIKRQEIQLSHELTNEQNNYWHARTRLELAIGRMIELPTETVLPNNQEHQHMDHSNHMDHSKHMDHSTHKNHSNTEDTVSEDHSAHEGH